MFRLFNFRYFVFALIVILASNLQAQELFVFTEPASNMPSKAIGLRSAQFFMKKQVDGKYNNHVMPELMFGLNKKLMLHTVGFVNKEAGKNWKVNGAGLYAKYRILSNDQIKSHYRMAAYTRLSYNKMQVHQKEIETMGNNSGYELGIIATLLQHKLALSSSISYEKALEIKPHHVVFVNNDNHAINYSLSIGQLVFPTEYKTYKQINLNAMIEFLGQRNNANGQSFLDIAPSIQFIFNSQARVDLAYRKQLYSNLQRTAPNGLVIKFEYTFFNVIK